MIIRDLEVLVGSYSGSQVLHHKILYTVYCDDIDLDKNGFSTEEEAIEYAKEEIDDYYTNLPKDLIELACRIESIYIKDMQDRLDYYGDDAINHDIELSVGKVAKLIELYNNKKYGKEI